MTTLLVSSPQTGCMTRHWTVTVPEPCTLHPVAYPDPESTEHVPFVTPSGSVPVTKSVSVRETRSSPADTLGRATRVMTTVAMLT